MFFTFLGKAAEDKKKMFFTFLAEDKKRCFLPF